MIKKKKKKINDRFLHHFAPKQGLALCSPALFTYRRVLKTGQLAVTTTSVWSTKLIGRSDNLWPVCAPERPDPRQKKISLDTHENGSRHVHRNICSARPQSKENEIKILLNNL